MQGRAVAVILGAAVLAGILIATLDRGGEPDRAQASDTATERSEPAGSSLSATSPRAGAGRLDPDKDAAERRSAPGAPDRTAPGDLRGGYAPDPLTEVAMQRPDMRTLAPGDPSWSAVSEAQQRFHAFERDILAMRPLRPDSWKALQKAHQDDVVAVFQRAKELTDQDRPEDARALMDEWNRLTAFYKDEAYGRGGGAPPAE